MSTESMRRAGTALLSGLLCVGVWASEETSPASTSAHESMTAGLGQLRRQIKNGHIRLTNGVSGVADVPAGMEAGPPTPALICCSSNLRRIEGASTRVEQALDELGTCYEERGDSEHFIEAQLAKQDLDVLGEQVDGFRAERDRRKALAALSLAGRAYLQLLENASALPPCPPVETSDKKRKNKKKAN